MDYAKESLRLHEQWGGKIEVNTRVPVSTKDDLSLAYTPGVAQPCLEIQRDPDKSYTLTRRHNLCAVITDGSAVLGLGDIGPEAGMPVMEGKCVLFKAFADVDAFPLCIRTKDVDEFVRTVYLLSGSFGGINLEDISAPRCFEIERKLKQLCDIPVFHDDQHGTAIITLAGLTNALRVVGKRLEDVKIVLSGAGAAAISISKLLLSAGARDVTLCDRVGAIYAGRPENMNWIKTEMAEVTNLRRQAGTLADVVRGADVFIGVSQPGLLTGDMVRTMHRDAIVFACANPTPEIFPDEAKAAGAAVVSTGRSDYPNQINNVLAFPGIFRGAFDVRASDINEPMKLAAAHALSALITPEELCADYIIPKAFDPRVGPAVAAAFDVRYAYQKLDPLPAGYAVPAGRTKPWGTAHAVLCAAPEIDGPFAVINSDDYYGIEAYRLLYDFLAVPRPERSYAMVGFRLRNTVTANGSVSRGVCTERNGMLESITERTHIEQRGADAAYTEDGEHFIDLPGDTTVSMNFWGFSPLYLRELARRFPAFLDENLPRNPLKCEYFVPSIVDAQLRAGTADVTMLHTNDAWHGVTYHDDLPDVVAALRALRDAGKYPDNIW